MFAGLLAGCLAWLPATSGILEGSSKETFIVLRDEAAVSLAEEGLELEQEPLKLFAGDRSSRPVPGESFNSGRRKACEDYEPEKTGFEIHTDEGFIGYASCDELSTKCHGWINSTRVQMVCPASCFICDPSVKTFQGGYACYDSEQTGVRFRHGPQATCTDLANYCNHTLLYYHVQAACRTTCGNCEATVGVPKGQCRDLDSHDEPEFTISGQLAACTDLMDFCEAGHADSMLIKHKCPRTCRVCADMASTTHSSYTTSDEMSFNTGTQENSDCDRRRRWGFCSSRRRRNI
jgi:hypothetical protein